MKVISCLQELKDYGIYPLTGEACGLGLRVLCDFDERGRTLLAQVYGIPDFKGAESWNSSTGGHEHVGSIMLDRDAHLSIGVFALLAAGCPWVYRVEYPESPMRTIRRLRDACRRFLYLQGAEEKEPYTDAADKNTSPLELAVRDGREALKQSSDSGLWSARVHAVYGFYGFEAEEAERWKESVRYDGLEYRGHYAGGDAARGFRNQHQMSGRVE